MKRTNSGFSMIEVLVASTIMLMMVLMLGMLFQQTSQAWQTGKQRAKAYQQVRAFFGAIQHDASAAIHTNSLLKSLAAKSPLPNKPQTFDGSLAFYTLTGTGLDGGFARRSVQHITYSDGKRTVVSYKLGPDGGYTQSDTQETNFNKSDKDIATIQVDGIEAYAFSDSWQIENFNLAKHSVPAFVKVSAHVVPDAVKSYNVGAASSGPDKIMGTKDDIKTWAD